MATSMAQTSMMDTHGGRELSVCKFLMVTGWLSVVGAGVVISFDSTTGSVSFGCGVAVGLEVGSGVCFGVGLGVGVLFGLGVEVGGGEGAPGTLDLWKYSV